MKTSTWAALALTVPVSLSATATLAQDASSYRCTFGDNVRRVEIVSEPGVSVPCEVHYYKDTEAPGDKQVLWSAQNEDGYCEARTRDFVVQLTNWGWSCEAGDPVMPAESADDEMLGDPAPADDTE